MYWCLHICLLLQTDSSVSGAAGTAATAPPKKKSLIDQFFSIEFETMYPKGSGIIKHAYGNAISICRIYFIHFTYKGIIFIKSILCNW